MTENMTYYHTVFLNHLYLCSLKSKKPCLEHEDAYTRPFLVFGPCEDRVKRIRHFRNDSGQKPVRMPNSSDDSDETTTVTMMMMMKTATKLRY
jgi:hypothetical protein